MEKTIKIGNNSVRLSNDIVWALNYRNQFGQDIIPTLMPALAAGIDIVSGLVNAGAGEGDKVDVAKILKNIDGDYLTNAIIHMGGLELNDLINITWSLAKTADEAIPDPAEWVKTLGDGFKVDEVAPVVFELLVKGVVSSKNLKRLEVLKKKLQPLSSSMTSYLQQQKED
ncbi:MAG: hypothetical protein IJI87_07430 [Mogibacterium sp.]|nr:hypothetical protein [Mogibacterium sp.]